MNNLPKDHASDFDFSQITEHIFLGTNLCCHRESHTGMLKKMNIEVEIDLEQEREDVPPFVDVYLWLPVKDKHAPSPLQMEQGVAAIKQAVEQNSRVYIHCRYGHGRSPTLLAAYFIGEGESVSGALDIIKKARPEVHLNAFQLEALKKYANL